MTDAALPALAAPRPLQTTAKVDWLKVYLGFGGMVIGQFMAILDIQIVAASLPQIQSGVGASADEISWIQTIYLLAEVVSIPLTAYLSRLWGTRPFYVAATIGFVATSIMTGLSSSFDVMVVTRALQGLSAGAMIPAVFATAMTVFPLEKRLTANVIIGLIVTLAPTIGPTLGGHLTEWLSWRWLFFVNVPPGLLVIFLVGRYGGFDKGDAKLAKGIDWPGLGLMSVFLLSMQYVLEEGSSNSWFADDAILWLTVTAVLAGVAFIWRQLTYRQPVVSLKPFRDRNFSLGVVMMFVSGMSLFGGMFVLPLFLAQILQYSAAQVGGTMMVGGLSMFVCAPLAGQVVRRIDARLAMIAGFVITGLSMGMGAHITADWGEANFAAMQVVRSVGMMIAMISAQQLTVSTMPPALMKDASSLVNLIRNVGGAVGLAMLSTLLSHQTAVHMNDLAGLVNAGSGASQDLLQGLQGMMAAQGNPDPQGAANKAFGMLLHRNAAVLAFGDAFVFLAAGCMTAAALAVFAKPAPAGRGPAPGGH